MLNDFIPEELSPDEVLINIPVTVEALPPLLEGLGNQESAEDKKTQ